MSQSSIWTSIILLAVGAAIGLFPTLINDVRKERRATRTRWDVSAYEVSRDFIGATRQLIHLCGQLSGLSSASDERSALLTLIEDQHRAMRSLHQQSRMVCNSQVQIAARRIVRHAYAIRAVAMGEPDPRQKEYPDSTPQARLAEEMKNFLIGIRTQLNVRHPNDVVTDEQIFRPLAPGVDAGSPTSTPGATG